MFIEFYSYFFIYAFLGWCSEVVFAALTEGKYVNRGFLNGPLCPIYGFGVIAVVSLLMPVKDNFFFLFIGSIVVTSTLELLTGFILEKIFHNKWWDYSDKPFNIGGYICPLFSLMWGIACLLVVDIIHPMVTGLVDFIPHTVTIALLAILTIVLVFDLIATINTIFKLNQKLAHIDELSTLIRKSSDKIGGNLAAGALNFASKKDEFDEKVKQAKEAIGEKIDLAKKAWESELSERKQSVQEAKAYGDQVLLDLKRANKKLLEERIFGQKRLLKAFPRLKTTRYKDALEALKENLLSK